MGHPEVPEGTPKPEGPECVTFTRTDLVCLRRALAAGWRVPDVILNEALYQVGSILAGDAGKRTKLAAARVLVQMTRVDLAAASHSHATDGSDETQAIREFLDAPEPEPEPCGPDADPAQSPGAGP